MLKCEMDSRSWGHLCMAALTTVEHSLVAREDVTWWMDRQVPELNRSGLGITVG